jgi:ribosomal protein L39E
MARRKTLSKKIRLGKQNKRTRWAPFWVIPKVFGQGKRVHPSRLTRVKRSWRRTKIEKAIKESKKRNIKSGRKKKKY